MVSRSRATAAPPPAGAAAPAAVQALEGPRDGRTLRLRVARHVAAQILSGAIPPGSLLPRESDLAAQFGVSRTILREALKILASKGLVEPRRKRGTVVCPMEAWTLFDAELLSWWPAASLDAVMTDSLMEVRRAFEPVAAELAAQRRTEEDIAELLDALDRMGTAPSPEAFSRADRDYHRVLFRAARSPMLVQLGRLLDPLLTLFLQTDRTAWTRPDPASVTLHRMVADAVVAGDAAAARRAMEGLIEWTRVLLRNRAEGAAPPSDPAAAGPSAGGAPPGAAATPQPALPAAAGR